MAVYQFTPDDLMQPVYCTQCRAHIPKAVSNANNGACDDCLAKTMQLPPSPTPVVVDTGLGVCLNCGSRNIVETKIKEATSSSTNVTAGLVISLLTCGLGLPLLIYGILQPGAKVVGLARTCRACGHQWRL